MNHATISGNTMALSDDDKPPSVTRRAKGDAANSEASECSGGEGDVRMRMEDEEGEHERRKQSESEERRRSRLFKCP